MNKNFKNVLLAVLAEIIQIAISYFIWQESSLELWFFIIIKTWIIVMVFLYNNSKKNIEIMIQKITSVVINNKSYYLIKTEDKIYRCSIDVGYKAAFLEEGQNINVVVVDDNIIEIK